MGQRAYWFTAVAAAFLVIVALPLAAYRSRRATVWTGIILALVLLPAVLVYAADPQRRGWGLFLALALLAVGALIVTAAYAARWMLRALAILFLVLALVFTGRRVTGLALENANSDTVVLGGLQATARDSLRVLLGISVPLGPAGGLLVVVLARIFHDAGVDHGGGVVVPLAG